MNKAPALFLIAVLANSLSGCFYFFDKMDADRRSEYVSSHPKLSPARAEQIRAGKIQIGMTEEEVKASWGDPANINRTVTTFGANSQWVYTGGHYIYFDNGILTTMQDFGSH